VPISNKIVGVLLILLGVALLLGWLHLPFLVETLGIVLIVLGALMLFQGSTLLGIVVIVVGALVLAGRLPGLVDLLGGNWAIVNTVLAVLLIVLGALKVAGR
jgi:hypothetical protein